MGRVVQREADSITHLIAQFLFPSLGGMNVLYVTLTERIGHPHNHLVGQVGVDYSQFRHEDSETQIGLRNFSKQYCWQEVEFRSIRIQHLSHDMPVFQQINTKFLFVFKEISIPNVQYAKQIKQNQKTWHKSSSSKRSIRFGSELKSKMGKRAKCL